MCGSSVSAMLVLWPCARHQAAMASSCELWVGSGGERFNHPVWLRSSLWLSPREHADKLCCLAVCFEGQERCMLFFTCSIGRRAGVHLSPLRLKGGSASWSDSSATQRLRDLAKAPYDLTVNDAITPARISSMQVGAGRHLSPIINACSDQADNMSMDGCRQALADSRWCMPLSASAKRPSMLCANLPRTGACRTR